VAQGEEGEGLQLLMALANWCSGSVGQWFCGVGGEGCKREGRGLEGESQGWE